MNKLRGKISFVDANDMHNNHCEYDTLMTFFPCTLHFLSQLYFLFNWKPRRGRTIYSDVWHSAMLKWNVFDKIAVWIALPLPVQLIANLSAIHDAQFARTSNRVIKMNSQFK